MEEDSTHGGRPWEGTWVEGVSWIVVGILSPHYHGQGVRVCVWFGVSEDVVKRVSPPRRVEDRRGQVY